ncbi:MAG TPA: cytochrome c nitrite reductase small subunit [Bacteroidia bacterium]|nr:cytochrome c nitrite reductase small subunit [Sphingobacteriales bacterium]HPD65236.1 cytochrome c nitrite reductase small subunit [Bacteroidia bacterium]HRS58615.1 cytochrome c nitrite reductase small subunit [Bacteroidia bacterium]HRU68018.1 cytochrome c nitrite reductase small subunit [Bacteroidia bacterium]
MIKRVFQIIRPEGKWKIAASVIGGAFLGIAIYLFIVSNASSYLSDDPATCVNCHLMSPQYSTWYHSSHREVTNCNDCHVPHNNVINKYFFKAKDGLRHATVFTLRNEPQVIFIKSAGIKVVQENCKRCHEKLNENTELKNLTGEKYLRGEDKVCWSCHREVPHGRVNSLSSTVHTFAPLPEDIKLKK